MAKSRPGYVYDRQERRRESWWFSRRDGDPAVGESRRPRRLVLIDIALLVVMVAVLVPWILRSGMTGQVGPYRVRIEKERDGESIILTMKAEYRETAEGGEEFDAGDGLLVWELRGGGGELFHSEADLLPSAEEPRVFIARVRIAEGGIDSVVRIAGAGRRRRRGVLGGLRLS